MEHMLTEWLNKRKNQSQPALPSNAKREKQPMVGLFHQSLRLIMALMLMEWPKRRRTRSQLAHLLDAKLNQSWTQHHQKITELLITDKIMISKLLLNILMLLRKFMAHGFSLQRMKLKLPFPKEIKSM